MQISGTKSFPTSLEQTYELLTNPDVLARAMPGVKSLTAASDTLFEAEMEVGVAGIKGNYQGHVEMKDVVEPESYRLIVNGEGPMGFMEADVAVRLTAAADGGSTVTYDGEAKVGGIVAGVGQRMVAGVAKLLINQFFNAVVKESRNLVAE